MPRNSSGTYTLPSGNPVAPNTIIETAWANPTMSDLGAALTDSLDRYGRGSMLAPIKEVDGAFNAPVYSFAGESTLGIYRSSSGVLGVAVAGLTALSISATAATFNAAVHPVWAADPVSANDLVRKSYLAAQVGLYLPLAGGTLTGALAGTTAAFTGSVNALNFLLGTGVATDSGAFGFTVAGANGPRVVANGNTSAGAGRIDFASAGGIPQVEILPLASAVNFFTMVGAASGNGPSISVAGSDANVQFNYTAKGTGQHAFFSAGVAQFTITPTASANRFITVTGSNGGNPSITTSAGLIGALAAIRESGGGSTAGDVASSYTLHASDKLCFVDSTRTADNRQIEFNWSAGTLQGRFVNDAYSAATNWITVSGGQSAGVTSTTLISGTAEAVRIAGGFVNISAAGTTATYQAQVQGAGQGVANVTDAGSKLAALYLRDSSSAGAGQGGLLLFGAFNSATPFAGVKGFITDAASNMRGDLIFVNRRLAADAFLTENMRIIGASGVIQDGGGNELGFKRLPAASVTTGAFVAADSGKLVSATAGVTAPNATMVAGDVVTIYNTTAGNITITATVTTLTQAGTGATGNRTLAAKGLCTILFLSGTSAVISGSGVT